METGPAPAAVNDWQAVPASDWETVGATAPGPRAISPGVKITGYNSAGSPIFGPEGTQPEQSVGRFLSTAGGVLADTAKGIYHGVTDPARNKTESDLGPVFTPVKRLLVDPQAEQAAKTSDPNISGAERVGHGLASITPLLGPWAATVAESVGKKLGGGDYVGAGGEVAGNAALLAAGEGVRRLAPKVANAVKTDRPAALASTLARTPSTGDKGFIPQQVAKAIADPVRQVAANNPQLVKVVQGSDPVAAYAAHQAILDAAQKSMDATFNQVLDPVKNWGVNPRSATQALKASDALHTAFPDEAKWVNDFYDRLDQVSSLGELNEMRRLLNERAAQTYKAAPSTVAEFGKVSAYREAADTLRKFFYDKLQQATGQDMTGLKRTEGALIDAKTATESAAPGLTKAHQIHHERRGPVRTAADIVKGTKQVSGGAVPGLGYLAEKMEGSQLNQVHHYLKDFYGDLPPASVKPPAPTAGGGVRATNVPNPPNQPPGLPGGFQMQHQHPAPRAGSSVHIPGGPALPGSTDIATIHRAGHGGTFVPPGDQGLPAPHTVPTLPSGARKMLPAPGVPDKTFRPAAVEPVGKTLAERAAEAEKIAQGGLAPRPGAFKAGPEGVKAPVRGELPGKTKPTKAQVKAGKAMVGKTFEQNGMRGTVTGYDPKTGQSVVKWEPIKNATDSWAGQ